MLKTVEIYLRDLKPEARRSLLEGLETTGEEENWDVLPIAVIDRELDDDERNYDAGGEGEI